MAYAGELSGAGTQDRQAELREEGNNLASQNTTWSYGGSAQNTVGQMGALRGHAEAASRRPGFTFDDRQYGQSAAQAAEARGQQMDGLGMLRDQMDMSQGTAATAAIRSGAQQSAAMQSSLAGLARGGLVGQRAAQSQAYMGNLNMGQQAQQQAGIVRAREAQQAALQYGQSAANVRAGDMAMQGQDQALAVAQADARMRNDMQNAARERGYEDIRGDAMRKQQEASQNRGGDYWNQERARWAAAQGDEAAAQQYRAGIVGAVGQGAAAAGNGISQYYTEKESAEQREKDKRP